MSNWRVGIDTLGLIAITPAFFLTETFFSL